MRCKAVVAFAVLLLAGFISDCGNVTDKTFTTSQFVGISTNLSIGLPFMVDEPSKNEPVPDDVQEFVNCSRIYTANKNDVALTVRNMAMSSEIDFSALDGNACAAMLKECAAGDYEELQANSRIRELRMVKNESLSVGDATAYEVVYEYRVIMARMRSYLVYVADKNDLWIVVLEVARNDSDANAVAQKAIQTIRLR